MYEAFIFFSAPVAEVAGPVSGSTAGVSRVWVVGVLNLYRVSRGPRAGRGLTRGGLTGHCGVGGFE